jgi:hypothetical protein
MRVVDDARVLIISREGWRRGSMRIGRIVRSGKKDETPTSPLAITLPLSREVVSLGRE